ncbi:MAG: SufD family Fe-S cluster assembly protein [Erysipelotrichales bacterium]|nr:SufD family Fe-S cluster assembly protein [Erysipelotrichales bacterium]
MNTVKTKQAIKRLTKDGSYNLIDKTIKKLIVEDGVIAEVIIGQKQAAFIKVKVGKNSSLRIINLIKKASADFEADVYTNGELRILNFTSHKDGFSQNIKVNLLSENASANIYTFDSNERAFAHDYHFQIDHLVPKTKSMIKNYFIAVNSQINGLFSSHIAKDCINSEAFQQTKGIVIGDKSAISAVPELLIDCFDVKASHGLAIGKLSDDILFYAMSRGLTELECLQMIIKGYLSPLIAEITDESFKDFVTSAFSLN